MKKSYNKWFFTKVKRAVRDYAMISQGDRIAVGVSGGKDSTFLLYMLAELRRQLPVDFSLQPVALDLGLEVDLSPLASFCRQLGLTLHVEKTRIYQIVFQVRQESNPSSLCAKLRRGALHQAALQLGCNKVAWAIIWTMPWRLFFSTSSTQANWALLSPSISGQERRP